MCSQMVFRLINLSVSRSEQTDCFSTVGVVDLNDSILHIHKGVGLVNKSDSNEICLIKI